jgi:hypothetical protein
MPYTRVELRKEIRNKLEAWPDLTTTLNGDITATAATLVVADADGLAARMLLEIGSEILQVVSISGTTITVTRGARGSTAATHSNGATIKAYPFWGWCDSQLNDYINSAIRWLKPEVWYGAWIENTLLAERLECGLPDGVRYPEMGHVHIVQFENDDGDWQTVYAWQVLGDRMIFEKKFSEARDMRLFVIKHHAELTSDATEIRDNDIAGAIVAKACNEALEQFVGNRARFTEYSAALNDRASTVDELQRAAFAFFNKATLEKDRLARPRPPTFASTRRA